MLIPRIFACGRHRKNIDWIVPPSRRGKGDKHAIVARNDTVGKVDCKKNIVLFNTLRVGKYCVSSDTLAKCKPQRGLFRAARQPRQRPLLIVKGQLCFLERGNWGFLVNLHASRQVQARLHGFRNTWVLEPDKTNSHFPSSTKPVSLLPFSVLPHDTLARKRARNQQRIMSLVMPGRHDQKEAYNVKTQKLGNNQRGMIGV